MAWLMDRRVSAPTPRQPWRGRGRARAAGFGNEPESEATTFIHQVVRQSVRRTLSSLPSGCVITLGELAPEIPALAVPAPLAAEVLTQVLINAMRSAAREVSLVVRREQDLAIIGVRDDGPGFAPADVNEIFIPSVRGLAERHAPIRIDRGLSVAHRLARSVGGDLTAVPDPSAGLVEVRLPLAV